VKLLWYSLCCIITVVLSFQKRASVRVTLTLALVIAMNDSYLANSMARASKYGYIDFLNRYSDKFPPPSPIPVATSPDRPGCDTFGDILTAIFCVNSCFNVYHLKNFCPYLWDELEFPSLAGGPRSYFNRSDVQAQFYVPLTNFDVCSRGENVSPMEMALCLPPLVSGPRPLKERTIRLLATECWISCFSPRAH
jgi:carboxypeptidase D